MTAAYWKPSAPLEARERPVRVARSAPPSADLARLREALDAIPNCGSAELSYGPWFSVVCAIHFATDGSDEGLELAHEFSARSSKHVPAFLDERVWPYIRSDREGGMYTAETVYAMARSFGWEDPGFADGFECAEAPAQSNPAMVPHENPFQIVHAADFRQSKPLRWIVRDVVPHGALVMVYGASGAGKSFVVLDLACAVARHLEDWRGKRVHGGRVLYVVAEGAHGFRRRLEAHARENDIDLAEVDLMVLPAAPNFTSKTAVTQLIDAAKAAGPFCMIVIDTLARVALGADENDATDMGIVLANAEAVGRATGATILLIHHSGKDAGKGARGTSAIRAAVDAELEVVRADNDDRSMAVTKMRDGEDGAKFGFRLRTVDLGRDEEGEPITSCVVEHADYVAPLNRPRMSRTKKLVLDAVRDGIGLDGGLPTMEGVIEACVPMIPGKPFAARYSAKRALNSLLEEGLLEVADGGLRLSEAGARVRT